MNILLINHYAGTREYGMEYRPYYLAREWVKLGHRVTIAAASYSHVRSRPIAVDGMYKEENIEGIRYLWIKTPTYSGNSLGRIRNILTFITRLWLHLPDLVRNDPPDLVIASSTYPLDIFPAHRVAQEYGAKLVFEVHDLWPLSPIILGEFSRWHPYILTMQMAEDYAYKHSDFVVSLLEKADTYMKSRGMHANKFVHIPNGVDVDEWDDNGNGHLPQEYERELAQFKAEGSFLVGYAGAHGLANSLDTLVDTADLLRNQPVKIILVGSGPAKVNLQKRAEQKGLDNIRFWDQVPKGVVPTLLQHMDSLYIGLKKGPLFQFGISPNKLLDYMMAGRPVIQAIDAGNDMVSASGCGFTVPPDDPNAVAAAVKRLLILPKPILEEIGSKGRDYVMSMHDYRVLARRFLDATGWSKKQTGPYFTPTQISQTSGA
jgi:glycosyltransferase involved in cell wall biosynthesis